MFSKTDKVYIKVSTGQRGFKIGECETLPYQLCETVIVFIPILPPVTTLTIKDTKGMSNQNRKLRPVNHINTGNPRARGEGQHFAYLELLV